MQNIFTISLLNKRLDVTNSVLVLSDDETMWQPQSNYEHHKVRIKAEANSIHRLVLSFETLSVFFHVRKDLTHVYLHNQNGALGSLSPSNGNGGSSSSTLLFAEGL